MGEGKSSRGPSFTHEQRRDAIISAVIAVVDSEGVDRVSLRRVADAARVSLGGVQHYFATKDELLVGTFSSINGRAPRRVRERLDRMTDGAKEPAPGVVLQMILDELLPRTDADRRLYRVARAFEAYALASDVLREHVERGYTDLADLIAYLLRDVGGEAADVALCEREARGLLATTLGLGTLTAAGALSERDTEEMATAQLDAALARVNVAGTAPRPAPRRTSTR